MENPLIEFKDVVKRFGDRAILNGVDLKIYENHVTSIIGKSGAGKSVVLKLMIGLLKPDAGCILFSGKPMDTMGKDEWNRLRGRISYMFQNNALFDGITVFENVALPLRQTTRLSRTTIDRKVLARIEQMDLAEAMDKYPSQVSGGMQKRVALCRALVTDPDIVFFDEPTAGQDIIRKNTILGIITRYQKQFGFTAVLINHDIPDVLAISSRIIGLHEGKIIFQGNPDAFEMFQHPLKDEYIESRKAIYAVRKV
jgi:phospholipid/cholesterol/gamma-HCH transport system ATP-binding protein